ALEDVVDVYLPLDGKPRVEIRGRGFHRDDLNRTVELVPHRSGQLPRAAAPRCVKMEARPGRVNAGVRPAAGVNPDGTAEDGSEARLDDVLDAPAAGLALPAREAGAV